MIETTTIPTIPTPLTPLIGRDAELAHVMEMLSGEARLLTITGIGGIGKTRLATQVALEMEPHFSHGVVLVPLADQYVEAAIPAEITKAFGQASPGIDVSALASIIGRGSQLLVLDNLEQIPDAGGTISDIVSALPQLTVLCTSQMPLDVPGEHVYPLQPMPVADGSASAIDLRANASIAMFMYRAHAANPHLKFDDDDLRIVADICAMLDGIPLAIELAAARTSILPLNELQVRLEHRLDVLAGGSKHAPGRLRTMRNAIRWSYGLLNPDEQRIFKHLGVYSGNLHIDAVAHTLTTLNLTESPLDTIETFVGRSLLRRVPGGGYQMLQTLREFALEQLDADGDAHDARLAQATYVVALAEEAELKALGPEQTEIYKRLGRDLANIRSASQWAVSHQPEIVLRILKGMWRYLEAQGLAVEFARQGDIAIDAVTDPVLRAPAMVGTGYLHEGLRELDQAESNFSQAIEIAKTCNDHLSEIRGLSGLGLVAMNRSQTDTAQSLLQRANDLSSEHNYTHGRTTALGNLASLAVHTGKTEEGEVIYRKVIDLLEDSGDKTSLIAALSNIAGVVAANGNPRLGREYALRAMQIADEIGDVTNRVYALSAVAGISYELGDLADAKRHYEESIQLAKTMGMSWFEIDSLVYLAILHLKTGDHAAALKNCIGILSDPLSTELVRSLLTSASVVASIAESLGENVAAIRLISSVLHLREEVDSPAAGPIATREHDLHNALLAKSGSELKLAAETAQSWDCAKLQEEALDTAHRLVGRMPAEHFEVSTPHKSVPALSPREHEVLEMVAKGLTNFEISDAMFISKRTTTTHLSNIFNKLDVKNRSSAVAVAREFGLLPSS